MAQIYVCAMNIFNALSDPNREKMIKLIAANGALSAGDIAKYFKISAPAISQHLKVLRDCGLVNVEICAQKRIYHINDTGVENIENWLHDLKKQMEKRLDRLEIFLAEGKDLDS
jgi:DNA-binding transcriptional ArsR family regulator